MSDSARITFRRGPLGKLVPLADGKEIPADAVTIHEQPYGISRVTLSVLLFDGVIIESPEPGASGSFPPKTDGA